VFIFYIYEIYKVKEKSSRIESRRRGKVVESMKVQYAWYVWMRIVVPIKKERERESRDTIDIESGYSLCLCLCGWLYIVPSYDFRILT